jgi:hypothetical protein
MNFFTPKPQSFKTFPSIFQFNGPNKDKYFPLENHLYAAKINRKLKTYMCWTSFPTFPKNQGRIFYQDIHNSAWMASKRH